MSRSSTRQTPDHHPNTTPAASAPPFQLLQTTTSLAAIPSSTETTLIILVHATNAFGTWGAGFAKALQTRYPSAELVYKSWCDEMRQTPDQWPSRELVGRCLVVEAQEEDQSGGKGGRGDGVAIACLFTSFGYGGRAVRGGKSGGHAAKDGREMVVESTRGALVELRGWIRDVEGEGESQAEGGKGDGAVKEGIEKVKQRKVIVYSPKFNSGNFGVD